MNNNKGQDLKFRIGEVTVKPSHNQLIINHEEVVIEPLAMAMLVKLAKNHGEVIYRQQLMEELWHAKVVTNNSLHRIVTLLRKGLNDDAKKPKYIETVPKKGYKLIHPIEWLDDVEYGKRKKIQCVCLAAAIFSGLSLIISIFFWTDKKVTEVQLINEQQVTSSLGVEHSAVYLPKFNEPLQSLIFVYENRENSHNIMAIKTINKSAQFAKYSLIGH